MKRAVRIAAAFAFVLGPLIPLRAQDRPSGYISRAYERGETFAFSLSWLRVVGGTAEMTVTPDPRDPRNLRIHSLAQSNSFFSMIFPVRDEIESIVDRVTFSTLSFQKTLREGRRSKSDLTNVDPDRGVALRRGTEIKVPKEIFDPLSTIFYLRRFDLTPGKVYSFSIIGDGRVYPLVATVTGREVVDTDAGHFATVVVEPKMSSGGIFRDENDRLQVWYTDDERHLPVRIRSEIKAGNITATLSAYKFNP